MDEQVKKSWVEALRSGEYQQGQGALQRNNEFCCLGVLCDVVNPDGWGTPDSQEYVPFTFAGEKDDCSLPRALERELGIPGESIGTLMGMNDSNNEDFLDIADYIENNL